MDKLQIDKKTPILCYGAGEVGKSCAFLLRKNGYNVAGFLDSRKSGRGVVPGFFVYRADEDTGLEKHGLVVIVCLADGMQHPVVAQELYSHGYRYISFLPMGLGLPVRKSAEMTRDYNALLSGRPERVHGVGEIGGLLNAPICETSAIIRRNGQEMIVWLPSELLYTESLELWEGDISKVVGKEEYKDIPVTFFEPFDNLYEYLEGRSSDWNLYQNRSKIESSVRQKQVEITKREKLWRIFEQEYQFGLGFFIEGCPSVQSHPNRYFCLRGGHHRTLFLWNKGHILIPVRMSEEQYVGWFNDPAFQSFLQLWNKQGRHFSETPIPHPGFLRMPSHRENTSNLVIAKIWRELFGEDFQSKRCLDASAMDGYFSRHFIRRGAKTELVGYEVADDREYIKELFSLLRLGKPTFASGSGKKYHYSVCVNRADEIGDEELWALMRITEEKLFVELNADFDRQRLIEGSRQLGFQNAEDLGFEVVDGIKRDLVVFRK